MYCVVLNCKSSWGPNANIKFHSFPKDEKRRNTWLSIIPIKNNFYPSAKICSLHFNPDDYNPKRPGSLISTATPFYLQNSCNFDSTLTKKPLSGKMSNRDVKTDSDNEIPTYEYFQDKNVCRLCWSKEGEQDLLSPNEKTPLENELIAKIKYCLNLEFEHDSFPTKACRKCCLKLEEFYEFKFKCQKSEKRLQEILKTFQENANHTEIIYDVKIEREDDCESTDKKECDSYNFPEKFINTNCSSNNQNVVKSTDNGIEVEINESKCLFEHDLDNDYTYNEHDYHTSEADEDFKNKVLTESMKKKKDKITLKSGINIQSCEKRLDNNHVLRVKKKKYERKRSPTYCNICRSDFGSKEMFDSHNASSHGIEAENQFKCFGCEKRLKTRKARFNHERTFCKGLKDGYKCSICDRFLPRRSMYDRHMRDHEKNHNIKLPEDIFQCGKCKKYFKTKLSLKEHMDKLHPLKRNYVCETCGRVFTRTDYLYKHRLTHTGTKLHACPHCVYRSTQKSSLNVHMRKHTGEKPYSCDLCPQQCTSSSNLRKHRRSHLGNKTFECTICSKKFGYKISLEEHIASVHERSQAFPCELCGALYTRSRGLRRHLHAKHGKQKVDKLAPRDGSTCEEVSTLPKDVASKCDENVYLKILNNANEKKVISENTIYEIKEGDEFVLLNADSGLILTKMY